MPRYIDAKQLEKQVKEALGKINPYLMGQMLRWISNQTTIDVERGGRLRGVTYDDGKVTEVHIMDTDDAVKVFKPVVRCRECEKRDKDFVSANGTISCPYMEAFMPSDGFCSYGERKEGAE